jgi:hypothetical protein
MRFLGALLVILLVLTMVSGCSTSSNSFCNATHLGDHFAVFYWDLDRFHVDFDRVCLDFPEPAEDALAGLD